MSEFTQKSFATDPSVNNKHLIAFAIEVFIGVLIFYFQLTEFNGYVLGSIIAIHSLIHLLSLRREQLVFTKDMISYKLGKTNKQFSLEGMTEIYIRDYIRSQRHQVFVIFKSGGETFELRTLFNNIHSFTHLKWWLEEERIPFKELNWVSVEKDIGVPDHMKNYVKIPIWLKFGKSGVR